MQNNNNKTANLKKNLSLLDIFSISTGAMISSGIFILPALLVAKNGSFIFLTYLIAGIAILPVLLAKSELITAMPESGGSYFFIERSMGAYIGSIGGFSAWLSLSLKTSFAILGIGYFTNLIYPDISMNSIKSIAILLILFFGSLNITGVKNTVKFQNIIVAILLLIMVSFIIYSSFFFENTLFKANHHFDLNNILSSVGLVFISFAGLTKIGSIAGEIKKNKDGVFGMFLSYSAVLIIYVLTTFLLSGILTYAEYTNTFTPLSLAGKKTLGFAGLLIMSTAGILAFVSTANAGILASSRYLLSMSRDRIIPHFISKVNKKTKTPHIAIIITMTFMILSILFLNLESLVKIASSMQIIIYILEIFAALIFKFSKLDYYRPNFIVPFRTFFYISGIILYLIFLHQMGNIADLSFILFFVFTSIWYFVYVKKFSNRKSAIIHVVENIIHKKLYTDSLENELRELLFKRDNIVIDEYYNIMNNSKVLYIEEEINKENALNLICKNFAETFNKPQNELYEHFIESVKNPYIIVKNGIAIPHIIVEGENLLNVTIMKSQKGIYISKNTDPIFLIIAIAGTMDKRNLHLKILSKIATVIYNTDFFSNLLNANTEKHIKDLFLMK